MRDVVVGLKKRSVGRVQLIEVSKVVWLVLLKGDVAFRLLKCIPSGRGKLKMSLKLTANYVEAILVFIIEVA